MTPGWWGQSKPGAKKRVNPETPITAAIRDLLRLMRIPHEKIWSGPMSPKGLPDILATIPGPTKSRDPETGEERAHPAGRACWIEVKVRGHRIRPEQQEFMDKMRAAGALAFFAYDPKDLVRELVAAGFAPAARLGLNIDPAPGQQPAAHPAPPATGGTAPCPPAS